MAAAGGHVADETELWSASAGLMGMSTLSFAEKVRQARQLDAVLEGFSSSDEEDGFDDEAAGAQDEAWRDARASWAQYEQARRARRRPRGKAAGSDDGMSDASTALAPPSSANSSAACTQPPSTGSSAHSACAPSPPSGGRLRLPPLLSPGGPRRAATPGSRPGSGRPDWRRASPPPADEAADAGPGAVARMF